MARPRPVINVPVQEDIRMVEDIVGDLVRVTVGVVDSNGVFIVPQQFEVYEITGEDLAELMSASPVWAPSKPANSFRREDLWKFVDKKRGAV